ncbi:C40 family peptidase [Streptomyces sp. OF3]|uniref:C40 family peptidase n=1 Tax=Streptomyces alkaliterrae TaxID=2213162 RepID=A0A7W3ZLV7_9ACTN|nr:C40 family peptidase [Streptomyces alkaliterrae]MBB1252851.1 C40 family peptidase [Streptomyces alkaliterrae]
MAAQHRHRRPRSVRTLPAGPAGSTAWAALVLAGAATTTTLGGGAAQAEPKPTVDGVKAEVDRLHRQAEEAAEAHHAAGDRARTAERRLEGLRDRAARTTAEANKARRTLGAVATAQYRSGTGSSVLRLALSESPEQYLRHAAAAEQAGARQAHVLGQLQSRLREVRQLRAEAAKRTAEVQEARRTAREHRRSAETKLARAQRLLDRLTAEQRARVLDAPAPTRGDRSEPRPDLGTPPPAAGRAAQAISYARGALGKPYVWGATGPNSFDCSGLTQAAWRSAGVSLPRTTYTQVNAGRRISRDQLAPGDLVFFYSGLTHVGLYVGNGQMIHAPRPGTPVRYAPITEMPFNTAVRVA